MITYKQHPFKAEINYAFREINIWLKSLGFKECFRQNENHFTEYHWIKSTVRICLKFEYLNNSIEKYIYLNADIMHVNHNYALKSCKFKYDDYDRIIECHEQFVNTKKKLMNDNK